MTDERESFLQSVLPRLTEVDTAFHNGDPEPRKEIWSERDPVTLFGAVMTTTGREQIAAAFDWLAEGFSNCEGFEYEVVAADASGDLGYIVGIEHTTASVRGAPTKSYELRVTTLFRKEDGEWKVVHRHGDAVPDNPEAEQQLRQMRKA